MSRRLRRLAPFVLLVSLCPLAEPAAETLSPLWVGLTPGSHTVGYRRLDDSSATVHVWYPAESGGMALTFGDYLGSESGDTRTFLAKVGVDSATIDRLIAARLHGTSRANPERRLGPLILVAQGNGQDAADQVVLCEFLASHGYVVAATPSPMRTIPMERDEQVAELAERQADDLARAATKVGTVLPVDTTRLAVVGHSFGARAGLLLAMRDSRVRGLVSLDGGIGTSAGMEFFRRAPSFRADAKLPALLHFYETLSPFMMPDFTLLESLHTERLRLERTHGMHHIHFTTYGFAAAAFPDVGRVTHATKETRGSVAEVAKETLAFLDSRLR